MAEATKNDYINAFESTKRYRSWLFIKTNNSQDVAVRIFGKLGNPKRAESFWKGKDSDHLVGDIVVVRSESVEMLDDESGITLIVPVDTRLKKHMGFVKDYISSIEGVNNLIEAHVKNHEPRAPYFSYGFISADEGAIGKEVYHEDPETIGLTKNSPGDNPWG